MNKKYNIGLDIGTTSVGWAVVEADTQKVIRRNGKSLWGVRLFDEAETAEARRLARSTRRRYDRRRNRIKLLQAEFNESINKVDPHFFQKLKESKYHKNDDVNKIIKLSKEEQKQIKNYNSQYKTIYHLRKRLIDNNEKEDIRLVYLAIHHIIKYRGNFLYSNNSFDVNSLNISNKLTECFDELINTCSNLEIPDNYYELVDINKLAEALIIPYKNDVKVELQNQLTSIFNKNFISEFGKLVIGNKFSINKLFMLEDTDKELKISFSSNDYEEQYGEIEDILGSNVKVLESLKELYNIIFLKKMFKDEESSCISYLMVKRYKQHEKDLELLKGLLKNDRTLYNKMFKSKKELCIYDQYIKNQIPFEEFRTKLNKLLEKLFDNNPKIDINLLNKYTLNAQKRIVNGEFLPRITTTENSEYPFQLNKDELIKIIENQGAYYPFLLDKTNDGVYKLVKLLEFRIPYYIGPLVSSSKSKFAWLVKKKEHIKITPYNFEEIVDIEKTAENFIKRMTGNCTYLLEEPALPNCSILYSKYKLMNELKQIRINGQKLTNEQQHKMMNDLFLKTSGNISNKKFVNYIRTCNDFDMYDSINVTGYSADGKFANNMQSYVDFFGENGIFEGTSYEVSDAERIIEWITIFDDKDILETKVRREYSNLSDKQLNHVLNKKYSGWGNLSYKLLTTKFYKDKQTSVNKSIMDLMFETEENFMQIINNKEYNFQQMIKENNNEKSSNKINYKLVADLVTSPATKKGIYQALKVVEELVEYMGYNPTNIVIEMVRGDEKKERKVDQKKYLTKLYENAKYEIDNYNKLIKELNDNEINSQKLFLYFIQEGKCLYSGKSLNIDDLDLYEIDHIIPRTLIKDDSIDNKALVFKECNQIKAANYVLPKQYRHYDNIEWWKHLKKYGLMSAKKYHNLIRTEYNDEDIQGFINRQLVETRQITKHVANILSNFYKKTNIIYLKASLSPNYRERYELFKFRDINDYHHAHDAYLAAVLGEYKNKYMKNNLNFDMVRELNERLRETSNYKNLKYGYVINSLDDIANDIIQNITDNFIDTVTGEILFDAKKFNRTIEKTLYRNDVLISRKTEIRSGQFYKQKIYPKDQGNVAQKENMPVSKYGGYKNVETSYMCLVKYGKKIRLIGIPVKVAIDSQKNQQIKMDFIKKHLGINNSDNIFICKDFIPYENELQYKGQSVYIKGYSVRKGNFEVCNALQLKIKTDLMKKWKYAFQYLLNNKKDYISYAYEYSDEIIKYLLSLSKNFPLFTSCVEKIDKNLDYNNLDIDSKKKIITELLKIYHCNSVNADFSSFGLGNRLGRLSGKKIDDGTLIFKSLTGLKEYKYELSNSNNK